MKGGKHVGKKLKELCRSRLAQFLTVQSAIVATIVQFAYCSDASAIYANVRSELLPFMRSAANTGIHLAIAVGIIASIVYMSSSNEQSAEKGKSWALRALGAIVLCYVLKSRLGIGILDKIVNELLL